MKVPCDICTKPVEIGKAYYCKCQCCCISVMCDDCTPPGWMLSQGTPELPQYKPLLLSRGEL